MLRLQAWTKSNMYRIVFITFDASKQESQFCVLKYEYVEYKIYGSDSIAIFLIMFTLKVNINRTTSIPLLCKEYYAYINNNDFLKGDSSKYLAELLKQSSQLDM